jgi:hypothetical protein
MKKYQSSHKCITEGDLNRQNSGRMSAAEKKTVANRIQNCSRCRKLSKEFWAKS